jgi:alkylated DNA nucleotide flippase Atl1
MPPIDFARARAFIAAVPDGRWTSYGEVAKAAGSPKGAQAVGQWCRREGAAIPFVYRVLTSDGFVAEGFVAAGPTVPDGEVEVRRMLADEGVRIDRQGRAAARQRFTADGWR